MTEQELYQSLRLHRVPENLHGGIVRYIVSGIKPGGFLRSVIQNDFVAAMLRADDDVKVTNLRNIARWVHNEAPGGCWGSVKRMDDWIEAKAKEFGITREVGK